MPHTNRNKKPLHGNTGADPKKKFSHPKREYITSEDGWTQVANKGWKSVRGKSRSNAKIQNQLIDMTIEEMVLEHERYRKQWESSDACMKLRSLFAATESEDKVPVKNVVCLGLGSLQALSFDWRRTSHTQLAALMTIKSTLNLICNVITQDPRFTELDKQFLNSMGCEVVDDPGAFQLIDDNSCVYAIHCPPWLLWKVKQRSCPALLIANDLRDKCEVSEFSPSVFEKSETETRPPQESTQGMEQQGKTALEYYEESFSLIQGCDEIDFPQLRYEFSSTMIYWRRSQTQEISPLDYATASFSIA